MSLFFSSFYFGLLFDCMAYDGRSYPRVIWFLFFPREMFPTIRPHIATSLRWYFLGVVNWLLWKFVKKKLEIAIGFHWMEKRTQPSARILQLVWLVQLGTTYHRWRGRSRNIYLQRHQRWSSMKSKRISKHLKIQLITRARLRLYVCISVHLY